MYWSGVSLVKESILTCLFSGVVKYMERAETLSLLRGDSVSSELKEEWIKCKVNWSSDDPIWKEQALQRFPASFVESAPENVQRMILWCLERTPSRRPTAEELLSVRLLPLWIARYYSIRLIVCLCSTVISE